MALKIAINAELAKTDDVSRYWRGLRDGSAALGLTVDDVELAELGAACASVSTESDIVVADSRDVAKIAACYAVVAVQFGSATERGLRTAILASALEDMAAGRAEWQAGQRKRTFWVACSSWAAYHSHRHAGVRANRIIGGAVDVDAFFPGERQVVRDAKRPVVLHRAGSKEDGHIVGAVVEALGAGFEVRALSCPPAQVPDAMRGADIWLGLSASEGLPTVVMEAQATDLVVVGTNVGVLWPYCEGTALHSRDKGAVAWLNEECAAVVFDWQWRSRPDYIADWVRAAWDARQKLRPQQFALKWYSLDLFGQKWVETLDAAARHFKLKDVPVTPKPTGPVRGASRVAVPRPQAEHTSPIPGRRGAPPGRNRAPAWHSRKRA